ncbi:hypothetical protein U0033_04445 [Chitinophaga sancti]|nr:hypothetical protein [Chitinophaga sancti]WQD63634.1 hypothetical protein U0033_04445 [Chitinophaga sancti]WQG90741.1 hypothetical protein SR876_04475 [Chitinophaga sancti]
MKDKQQTEYSIKYLGSVTVKNGNTYKIVNYQTYSKPVGLMQHGNCILLIYTDKNKFAGAYFVGDYLSLPDYLDNKELVFVGKFKCKEMTRVSLANGLPQQIYKKCTKKLGDMFEYSTMYPF